MNIYQERGVNPRQGVAELWRRVNAIIKPSSLLPSSPHIPPEDFNDHYSSISPSPNYQSISQYLFNGKYFQLTQPQLE